MQNYFTILENCPLFYGIGKNEIEELIKPFHYNINKYNKDALVAFRGDYYERLSIILEGKISAEIIDLKGKILKVESLTSPNLIASGILFASENRLPVQLRTEEEATILSISKKNILELCRRNELILKNLLCETGDKINFLADKIRLYQFTNIKQKIALYFLDLKQKQGSDLIHIPYTLDVLAELFGVSRPSLSRSLSELIELGIIERNLRDYEILHEQKLKKLLSE